MQREERSRGGGEDGRGSMTEREREDGREVRFNGVGRGRMGTMV